MRIMMDSGARTWPGAKSIIAPVTASIAASIGPLDLGFVDGLARVEPVAVVVAREAAQKT